MRYDDNLTAARPTFVTHLECAMEGDHYAADQVHNLSKAGKPLLVRYDLAGVKKALTKEALAERPADLWRYRELLPVRKCQDIVSLGEVTTPLIRLPKLSARLGGREIIVKDDMVHQVLSAITEAAKTGRIGDGKIFISTVEEAIRIRTGEHGNDAI